MSSNGTEIDHTAALVLGQRGGDAGGAGAGGELDAEAAGAAGCAHDYAGKDVERRSAKSRNSRLG